MEFNADELKKVQLNDETYPVAKFYADVFKEMTKNYEESQKMDMRRAYEDSDADRKTLRVNGKKYATVSIVVPEPKLVIKPGYEEQAYTYLVENGMFDCLKAEKLDKYFGDSFVGIVDSRTGELCHFLETQAQPIQARFVPIKVQQLFDVSQHLIEQTTMQNLLEG